VGQPSRKKCIAFWVLVPLICGIAFGLGASKSLWGFWWVQPTVQIDPASCPKEFTFFSIWPSLEVKPLATRNELVFDELRRCLKGFPEECTDGRALLHTPNVDWNTLPNITVSSVQDALDSARKLSSSEFLRDGQKGNGFVIKYDLNGQSLTLVTFNTSELHNDTHGYVEVLIAGHKERASLLDFAYYYYDVAGIEFATPGVLVVVGIVLSFLITALITAIVFMTKRVRRKRAIVKGG
jgi:hypothetical protein